MNNKGTEIYAVEHAKKIDSWHRIYDGILEKKIAYIDFLLKDSSDKSRELLCDILQDSEITRELCKDTKYGYMVIMNQIYMDEVKNGEEETIYDKGSSIEELISIFNQIKFLLWELEYIGDLETAAFFKKNIYEYRVSGTMLKNMILIAATDVGHMKKIVIDALKD